MCRYNDTMCNGPEERLVHDAVHTLGGAFTLACPGGSESLICPRVMTRRSLGLRLEVRVRMKPVESTWSARPLGLL